MPTGEPDAYAQRRRLTTIEARGTASRSRASFISRVAILTAALFSAAIGNAEETAPTPSAPRVGPHELRGAVRDRWHTAIEGSLIEAFDASGAKRAEARSDSRGAFVLSLPAGGLYRIDIIRAGFASISFPVDVGPRPAPIDAILEVNDEYVSHVHGARAGPPDQTGTSVAVISREALQALPGGDAQSLSDIIATEPGTVRDVFGIGPVHVRANQAGILYVLDGVPLPSGLLFGFADTIPTRLVQSVNVLTGGLPAEYGEQAGGVVDVTTRRPSDRPEGEVQVLYGSYQTIQPSAFYSQSLGKLDLFVEGTYLGTQLGLNPPSISPVLHDGMISGSAFLKMDYRATPQDRLELIAGFSQHNYQIPIDPTVQPLSDGPPGAVRGVDAYGNAAPIFVPYNANPTEVEQDLFVTASYLHTVGERTLQVAPYVRYTSTTLNCDPVLSLGATADPGSTCSNIGRRLLHEGATATYAWNVGERQRWKTGLLIDDAQSTLSYTQFIRNDESASGGPDPSQTVSGADNINILLGGAFLQDEITVGKAKFFPSVRVDVQNATYGSSGVPGLLLAGPSARLGLSYSLSDGLVLHAYAGYLWSPPSTLDAPVAARVLVPNLGAIPPSQNLKPERDEFAEIGLAWKIFRRLTASLTAWGRYSQDQIDIQTVGATTLVANYNYAEGRAVGVELAADAVVNKYLSGFANVTWEIGQGRGVDSAQYLFSAAELADSGWQILDHVQSWTVNAGADLHDESAASHFSALAQYGSGLRTGPDNDEVVPGHFTINLSVRHKFDFVLHPEVAVDVLNLLDAAYPLRIANGYFDGAYGPLRQVDVRLIVLLGG